mgnify:CR=1 FL=1
MNTMDGDAVIKWLWRVLVIVLVVGSVVGMSHDTAAKVRKKKPKAVATPTATPVPAPPTIRVDAQAQPLQPLAITIAIPNGPTGGATLVVADSSGRQIVVMPVVLTYGNATVSIVPRGARGWHSSVVVDSFGQIIAQNGQLYQYEPYTQVVTGIPQYDQFIPAATTIMRGAMLDQTFGDMAVHGYRSPDSPLIWLRDYVYQMRGARYFDADIVSPINAFAREQYADGSFPDFLPRAPWADTAYRTPVEADVEFLFVQGVYQAWQAGAGDDFARMHLGAMRRALTYTIQDPNRWDAAKGLVRRPFTIDMWDFEVAQSDTPRHGIDANTRWGIFHGDNTGMIQALRMLATIEERVGDAGLAAVWRSVADGMQDRLNVVSWNGQFYRHVVFDQPVTLPGVDVAQQLSLSNAYALNRGVLSDAQAQAILDTYISRRRPGAFAEWYSIDPPFPAGTITMGGRAGEQPGTYVNGGIMPHVGGELARGAFRAGYTAYGFANLDYYWAGMLSRGRSFLWYAPDGAEGVGTMDTLSTDGWGAASMLDAFIEGAVGVVDQSDNMRAVLIAPKWYYAAGLRDAYAVVRYAAGSGYVAYKWHHGQCGATIELAGSAERYQIALPIPAAQDMAGCSGTVSSPQGVVDVQTRLDGRVAVLTVTGPDAVVAVNW